MEKERTGSSQNNVSREEKGKEICQPILIENDAKRQEEKIQRLGGTVSMNEVDQSRKDGCYMANQA